MDIKIRESISLAEKLAEAEDRLRILIRGLDKDSPILEEERNIAAKMTDRVQSDINAVLLLPQARLKVKLRHITNDVLSSCFIGKLNIALLSLAGMVDEGDFNDLIFNLAGMSDEDKIAEFNNVVEEGDKNKIISVLFSLIHTAQVDIENRINRFEYDLSVLEKSTGLPS